MEHWFVVALNAWLMSFLAGIAFSMGVLWLGALFELQRVWADSQHLDRKSLVLAWVFSWVSTTLDRLRGHVGSVPIGELRDERGLPAIRDDRGIVVMIHGTFGAASGYDWKRWDRISEQFPMSDWQRLRFAWAGGNTEFVRHRAAESLARLLQELTAARSARQPVVLIGHSHGGSVACATAHHIAISEIVTIGTPFVDATSKNAFDMGKTIERGAAVRYLAPMAMCMATYVGFTTFGEHTATDSMALVLIAVPFLVGWFLTMSAGFHERNVVLSRSTVATNARATIVQSQQDWLVRSANSLEFASTAALDDLHRRSRQTQRIERIANRYVEPPIWRKPIRRMAYYLTAGLMVPKGATWIREVAWFAFTGALMLTSFAAIFYPLLPSGLQSPIAPWLFPAKNFYMMKFAYLAALIAIPYLLVRNAFCRHLLPSWHRSAFSLGQYWGVSARLSQIYSLKAHLYGFRSYTLHLLNVNVTKYPIGFSTPQHKDATVPEGPKSHSALLDSPECLAAIRTIVASHAS